MRDAHGLVVKCVRGVVQSQHRQINVLDLIDEALAAMEKYGGPGAGEVIKSYVPAWQPSSVELHRGFR